MISVIKIMSILLIMSTLTTGIVGAGANLVLTAQAPNGFTEQQILQAEKIATENIQNSAQELIKSSKFLGLEISTTGLNTETTSTKSVSSNQGGSNQLYAVVSPVEDQYVIYRSNYGGYLQIPVKTEIWNTVFVPQQWAYANYNLYYLNSNNNWAQYGSVGGWTDVNGVTNLGFSIPYKTSNKYYINGNEWIYVGGIWRWQAYNKFFTVSWY